MQPRPVFNPPPPIAVDVPRPREPAIFLSKFPPHENVSRRRRWAGISIVGGVDAPGSDVQLGDAGRMLLDLPRDPELMPLSMDPRLAPGLAQLWLLEPETGLTIPAHVHQDLRWEKSWNILTFASPNDVGVPIDPSALSSCAWRVLSRVRPEQVVGLALGIALRMDVYGPASRIEKALLPTLRLPEIYERRLWAELAAGRPFLSPQALRWIAREVCAWSAAGRPESTAATPRREPEAYAAEVFFTRTLCAGRMPSETDILRAFWLLHEGFHGPDVEATDDGYSLAVSAALSFGLRQRPGWVKRLTRADDIWSIGDDHPTVVAHNPPQAELPSALRAAAAAELGTTVSEWLEMAFAFSARYYLAIARDEAVVVTPETVRRAIGTSASDESFNKARAWCAADIHTVGDGVLRDTRRNKGSYRGLGSTPQHESTVFRDHPLVQAGDVWIPAGFDVLVNRFCDVPRLAASRHPVYRGLRGSGRALGMMFEAYASNVLGPVRERHRVLDESDLQAVLGRERKRGDAVVVHGTDYLVMETSLQRTPEGVAVGHLDTVRKRCVAYSDKAEQAEATLNELGRIAEHLGLPRPTSMTYIVVTENPLPLSNALAHELLKINPRRNPCFVVAIEELELAMRLVERGWSFPAGVAAWQGRGLYRPFLYDLLDMANKVGLNPWDLEPARRWSNHPAA